MKDDQLTEPASDNDAIEDANGVLREEFAKLERESQESLRLTEQRLILAELKVEAMRAGIVDLDGLKFLDMTQIHFSEDRSIVGGREAINLLKRAKPWLFLASSSSSTAKVPPAGAVRRKLATDMTDEEYRVARADIIRRSRF